MAGFTSQAPSETPPPADFVYYTLKQTTRLNARSEMTKHPVRTNASIDRIQAGGTYAPDNIRLVCHVVNEMRRDLTTEDFVEMCRKVVRRAEAGGE